MKNKHGIYFVTGNHEYYSGAKEWTQYLGSIGIKVLHNDRVRIGGEDGFDLAGHPRSDVGYDTDLKSALDGRDQSRACVLLSHQPRGIEKAAELGVDLQLSGHTHGGQMFPWNFMVRLQQPFVAGLHKLQGDGDLRELRDRLLGSADARRNVGRDHRDRTEPRIVRFDRRSKNSDREEIRLA